MMVYECGICLGLLGFDLCFKRDLRKTKIFLCTNGSLHISGYLFPLLFCFFFTFLPMHVPATHVLFGREISFHLLTCDNR